MSDEEAILAANAAYYRAFAMRDFGAMSRIWAEGDVSCIHPGWSALIGRDAVVESYRSILRNPIQEPIQYRDAAAIVSGGEGRVLCIEIVGGVGLAATNWFKRIGGVWRMIHHQASPMAAPVEDAIPEPSSRLLN